MTAAVVVVAIVTVAVHTGSFKGGTGRSDGIRTLCVGCLEGGEDDLLAAVDSGVEGSESARKVLEVRLCLRLVLCCEERCGRNGWRCCEDASRERGQLGEGRSRLGEGSGAEGAACIVCSGLRLLGDAGEDVPGLAELVLLRDCAGRVCAREGC